MELKQHMILQEINNLILEINKSKEISSSMIKKYEDQVGLTFGPKYKKLISKYGCISKGPYEIYGICGDNSSIPSTIPATISYRKNPNFPKNIWVISDDGYGNVFGVDNNDQVYFYDHETKICKKLNLYIDQFVDKYLDGHIKNKP